MSRRYSLALFGICAILLCCSGVYSYPLSPVAMVRRIPTGVTAEQFVREIQPTVPCFYYSKLDTLAECDTEVTLVYDSQNLYVAFRCHADDVSKVVSEAGDWSEKVLRDDAVCLVLDLDNDAKTFVLLAANPVGSRYGQRGRQFVNSEWRGNWTARGSREAKSWTVLFTIPFRTLGVPTPHPGTVWRANMSRLIPRAKQPYPTFWARVRKDVKEIQRGGALVFAGDLHVTAGALRVETPGRQSLGLTVSNDTGKPVRLRVDAVNDGRIVDRRYLTAETGASKTRVFFYYPFDGWHYLNLAVYDERTGRMLMRTPAVPVRMEEYKTRTENCIALVEKIIPRTHELASGRRTALEMLGRLRSSIRAAEGDKTKWNALGPKVEAAERIVQYLRSSNADIRGCGYVLGTETSVTKIFLHRLFGGDIGKPLRISLARNEYESGQVVILAHDRALEDVQISVSPLTGPGGVKLPDDGVKVNLVEFVKTQEPPYGIDYVGWYPDPLMEMSPFDVARGKLRPVWITVHTPENIPAGVYRGEVIVRPANAPKSSLPIEVEVWDFNLPRTPHLRTTFAFFEHEVSAWYGRPMTPDQRRSYFDFLLAHRLNPVNIYSKTPYPSEEDILYCVERGLNAFTVGFTNYKEGANREEFGKNLRKTEAYLKRIGCWDKAILYGFDELGQDRYAELRDMYGWVKSEFPDLPRMTTCIPNKQLKGYVDIWVPLTANLMPDEAEYYRRQGDEVWWYVCCGPEHPWPNFFVDYPAIDHRILFWMNWKYRIPGFLYWTVNRWHENLRSEDEETQKALDAGKRWPEIPWDTTTTASFNGDGHLIYPGPDGKPLSSIRLENIRDGIEDYEYFYILNERVRNAARETDPAVLKKARELLAVNNCIVKSLTEYTKNPMDLLDNRRAIAEMIEQLGG